MKTKAKWVWLYATLIVTLLAGGILLLLEPSAKSYGIAQGIDEHELKRACEKLPRNKNCAPLQAQTSPLAIVCIGGFADEYMGRMRQVFDILPLLESREHQGAYYYWHGGSGHLLAHNTAPIAHDISAWCEHNPQSTLVLIGHSYGGSATMDIARQLPTSFKGKLAVITLDPVSRREASYPRSRAPRVDYWINSYVTQRRNPLEIVPALGGIWDYCAEADVNLSFSGRDKDFMGRRHAHNLALSLLIERSAQTQQAAWDYLQKLLR